MSGVTWLTPIERIFADNMVANDRYWQIVLQNDFTHPSAQD